MVMVIVVVVKKWHGGRWWHCRQRRQEGERERERERRRRRCGGVRRSSKSKLPSVGSSHNHT
ncbi:putative proline-rich receptor-like protein kinase PERK2 [Iris pallida]|uniref:Proline-rich receptor-like protein kinase PERK2 n=1 Tax=Iris pallida TaxID=29817 RepID=A0AAX6G6K4_IRIPA|nr:putative proline-rich receptor-like protein kinase PERK2 [Iris pallida]